MLHELYAPQDVASIVWSRQKTNALLRILTEMQSGMREPSVILLYGPTGCGKLSSARAMLLDQRDAAGRPPLVEVMHSCEATPEQYYQFLMDTLTEYATVGAGALNGEGLSAEGHEQEKHWKQTGRVVRVVKFYGEPLSSRLHTLTLRFLNHYGAWRRAYNSESDNNSGGGVGGNAWGASLLRRHLVLFILTTHDTHSDKVALAKVLPSRVLTHPSIQFFHCTPLTPRNMATRVKDILRMEMQRRNSAVGCSSISDEHIRILCEQNHGDIRHALLQLQWYLLNETGSLGQAVAFEEERTKEEVEGRVRRCRLEKGERGKKEKNGIAQPRSRAPRTVMDLLDDDKILDDVDPAPCSSQTTGKSLAAVNAVVDGQRCAAAAAAGGRVAAPKTVRTSTLFRDEYLDVAHATARILSQKYTMSSVVEELNVQPDKLLGYLTNNMPEYFRQEQMGEYAACAAAASFSDSLRATGSLGKWRGADAGIHTTRLTADDDNEGAGAIGLDLMSLLLFGCAYLTFHKNVHIPRAFVPQKPPPFQPSAYPRLREVERAARKRSRSDGDGCRWDDPDAHDGKGSDALFSSEAEWHLDFLRRLQLHASSGNAWIAAQVDIVRESLPSLVNKCGSLDAIILEYASYARNIVLERPLAPAAATSGASRSSFPSKVLSSSDTAVKLRGCGHSPGPKRTMFSFSRVETPLPQPKRLCSLLRYNVLCLGLKEKPPIRSESFTLGTDEDDGDDNMVDVGSEDVGSSRPWLPEGEDIEEYSE